MFSSSPGRALSDRRVFSPTELAQLERCSQQMLFDKKHGVRRSQRWKARAAEGRVVHAELHRAASRHKTGRTLPLRLIVLLLVLVGIAAAVFGLVH
ncbi:MAG: hypothetical protein AAGH41_06690 [Pseudomonadota bacterium]